MYREKLKEQLEFLESLQKQCGPYEISEAIRLGKNILNISKRIDELDNERNVQNVQKAVLQYLTN